MALEQSDALQQTGLLVEVSVTWGDGPSASVLAVDYLGRGRTFSLGETSNCDVFVPSEVLGVSRAELLRWDDEVRIFRPQGAVASVDGTPGSAPSIVLTQDEPVEIVFQSVTFRARFTEAESFDDRGQLRSAFWSLRGLAASIVIYAAIFGWLTSYRSPASGVADPPTPSQLGTMRRLLEASDERNTVDDAESRLHAQRAATLESPRTDTRPANAESPASRAAPMKPSKSSEQEGGANAPGDETGHGVDVDDVGGLLASLKRRAALPQGIAHLRDREKPWQALQWPYYMVSDGHVDRGSLTQKFLRRIGDALRECYWAGLRKNEALAGVVAITFRIGPAG